MRTKKSLKNIIIGIATFLISFIPMFVVRKYFMTHWGADLLGLTSLFTNIVGYLSIVEMGIGSAIIYSLYKPFEEKDYKKVKGYLDYYKKFYRRAGLILLGMGLFIAPFIPLVINSEISSKEIITSFLLFLLISFTSYIATYKHCLVNVAQENYRVSVMVMLMKVLTAIGQLIVIVSTESFYLYIVVQIFINFLSYSILNKYINKKYSDIFKEEGTLLKEEKLNLNKNIKALFLHKIGSILVFGTDSIVISKFINLVSVTIYNNYLLITNACSTLIGQAMNGLTASIGNLLVVKEAKYAYKIHKKIFFVNFWVSSFISISLFNCIDQFMVLWVGEEYLLDEISVGLILINLYFQMMRGSVEKFKDASGEYYKDRYAPLIEGAINLILSICLAKYFGVKGVLLGTLISNVAIVFWMKPLIVYRYVFKENIVKYFKMYFKYFFIGMIPLLVTRALTVDIKTNSNIESFILNSFINILVINIIYIILFWKNKEFIYFKNIITDKLRHKV